MKKKKIDTSLLILLRRSDFIRLLLVVSKKTMVLPSNCLLLKMRIMIWLVLIKKSLVVTSTKSSDKFKMNLEIEYLYKSDLSLARWRQDGF